MLLPAYDDAAGVTAAFNLNLLVRINRELGANFDLESFAHVARWNPLASRIEMHLESTRAQQAEIPALPMRAQLRTGETIHTENSYKFTPAMVDSILQNGGFAREHTWYDPRRWFAMHLARVRWNLATEESEEKNLLATDSPNEHGSEKKIRVDLCKSAVNFFSRKAP